MSIERVNNTKSVEFQNSNLNLNVEKNSFTKKIAEIAQLIFEKMKNYAAYPLRYLGAKNVGYHFEMEKTLSSKETLNYVKYAAVAAGQHSCDDSWIKPFDLKFFNPLKSNLSLAGVPGNLQAKENCFFDETTGLKVIISVNDKEVIVGFGALDSARTLYSDDPEKVKEINDRQHKDAVKNLFGGEPKFYEQANAFFSAIKDHPDFQGKSITLAGQCLGGSIAQYVALKNQAQAVCFNTLPLGAGLQYEIGSEALKNADNLITHISAKTDFVSDNGIISIFDRALSFLGIRTPGNFGKRYDIPTPYTAGNEIHDYIMGSIMNHIGYDIRNKPEVLTPQEIAIAKYYGVNRQSQPNPA